MVTKRNCPGQCSTDMSEERSSEADTMGNWFSTKEVIQSHKLVTDIYRDQLWDAVNTGDIDKVRSLLEQGADPNHQLYWSEEWSRRKDKAEPPLHRACFMGFLEVVKLLVGDGADVDKAGVSLGRSPLHWACVRGHTDIVMYLVSEAKCAVGDHADVTMYLINEVGYPVDVRDKDGKTPLHHACYEENKDIVKCLVDLKCDVNVKDKDGRTPVDSCFEMLYESEGYGLDCLIYLIKQGCLNDQEKAKVLMAACYYARLDDVKELVEELNINPNVTDDGTHPVNFKGQSSLDLNLHYIYDGEDHLHVALYLIKRGCGGGDGYKAAIGKLICGACYWGKLDAVKEIVEEHRQVNPNHVRDKDECCDSQTPLHCASERGHKDVVQYLVEVLECDIAAIDDKDRTPLDVARNNDKIDVVEYLESRTD